MLSRNRTWVLDLFGIRDQRSKKYPTSGFSQSINLLVFDPSTVSLYNSQGGYQNLSPVFTISGNTTPVQLLWRQLSGKGISGVAYSKNGGAFVSVTSGTTFGSAFNDGDTVQLACNAFSLSTQTGAQLRIENVTDSFAVSSTILTVNILSGINPGG